MVTTSPWTAEIVRQSGAVPGAEYLLEVTRTVRRSSRGGVIVAAVVADQYRQRRRKGA